MAGLERHNESRTNDIPMKKKSFAIGSIHNGAAMTIRVYTEKGSFVYEGKNPMGYHTSSDPKSKGRGKGA